MTGTTRSSEGLDLRRRKLLFRSWHRGMREMDLIMGGFADARIASLNASELDEFERLIEVPDPDLLAWIIGDAVVPPDFDSALSRVADGAEGLVIGDLARAVAARPKAPATSLTVICRDGGRMAALSRALAFFAPDVTALEFPAGDCLPYYRSSPHAAIVAQRMTALARLAHLKGREGPSVLLTSVNAVLQRVPAR